MTSRVVLFTGNVLGSEWLDDDEYVRAREHELRLVRA